jgi:hypothetical protein
VILPVLRRIIFLSAVKILVGLIVPFTNPSMHYPLQW